MGCSWGEVFVKAALKGGESWTRWCLWSLNSVWVGPMVVVTMTIGGLLCKVSVKSSGRRVSMGL